MSDCSECNTSILEGVKSITFISGAQTIEIEKEDAYYCKQCQKIISKQEVDLEDDDNAYSYLSAREAVDRLYKKVLGREVDAGGLRHYVEQLESGKLNALELRKVLLNSEEYKNKSKSVENNKAEVDDMIIRL